MFVRFLLCTACIACTLASAAQKEDYVWKLGGGIPGGPGSDSTEFASALFDFSGDTLNVEYLFEFAPGDFTSTSVSSSSGEFLLYSNGANIYNKEIEAIENGDNLNEDFPFGMLVSQGALFLPIADRIELIMGYNNVYYTQPDNSLRISYTPLFHNSITQDTDGQWVVSERLDPISEDTLNLGQLTAIRHANGRDWWLPNLRDESNEYYLFLLDSFDITLSHKQVIGDTIPPNLGQVCASPDGRWLARYAASGSFTDGTSHVFLNTFDRCTGYFGEALHYEFPESPAVGGVAFSSDSRYLYVSKWDSIYQFDTQAADIFASRTLVGSYDGFLDERGLATRFFLMQLAPNGKIYVSTSNYDSKYIHVIHSPNEAGAACQFEQRAIKLPIYNGFSLPNFPQYRLYEEPGSVCDSLTVSTREPVAAAAYDWLPNPAGAAVTLQLHAPATARYTLRLYAATGEQVLSRTVGVGTEQVRIDLAGLPPGYYTGLLRDTAGRIAGSRKLIVLGRR